MCSTFFSHSLVFVVPMLEQSFFSFAPFIISRPLCVTRVVHRVWEQHDHWATVTTFRQSIGNIYVVLRMLWAHARSRRSKIVIIQKRLRCVREWSFQHSGRRDTVKWLLLLLYCIVASMEFCVFCFGPRRWWGHTHVCVQDRHTNDDLSDEMRHTKIREWAFDQPHTAANTALCCPLTCNCVGKHEHHGKLIIFFHMRSVY